MEFNKLYEEYKKGLEENQINVQCAWCKKKLGTKKDNNPNAPKSTTSHGMCPDCSAKVLADVGKDEKKKDKK